MVKIILYRKTPDYISLVEEIGQGFVEYGRGELDRRIDFKFWLAHTIKTHEAYKKFGKGNQDFVMNLAKDVSVLLKKEERRLSRTVIYDALEVSEHYKSPKELIEDLASKGRPLSWSGALELVGRKRDSTGVDSCRHCKLHCPE